MPETSLIAEHFKDDTTRQWFEQNGLGDFERLWTLKSEWVEPPNARRKGWSSVSKYAVKTGDNNPTYIFIKRQENHNRRTWQHPIKGVPTYQCEYLNIQRLRAINIPTVEVLFYGERIEKGNHQCILVTLSLKDYQSLDRYFEQSPMPPEEHVSTVMQSCGILIRRLHEANFHHGALYPKHFFIRDTDTPPTVILIDLEKLRHYPIKYFIRYNDLARMIRRGHPIPRQQLQVFLGSYLKFFYDLNDTRLAYKLNGFLESLDESS